MDDARIAVGVADAAKRLGIGNAKTRQLIREGHLRSFQIGDRRLIEVDELRRFVAERRTAEASNGK